MFYKPWKLSAPQLPWPGVGLSARKVAAPRTRNREEMIAAYEGFKVMFFNLPDQRAKDKSKQRSHLHAHMTSVARRGRRRNGRLRSTTAERGLQHQSLSR